MSPQMPNAETLKAEKVAQLFANLHHVLGDKFTFSRFEEWKRQYERPSRLFHGLDHLLTMSELDRTLSIKSADEDEKHSAAVYSMVAGFFHDTDYPSISETLTVSKPYIDKYIDDRDGKKTIKPIARDDRIGNMVLGVFGFKPGQELAAFASPTNPGGMNEFYCAVAAACELKKLGMDEKFIFAVVSDIEATIPFRKPERMPQLRQRMEQVNSGMKLGMDEKEIDEIMRAAVHIANKDVIGFLGGLDPMHDTAPTKESVLSTIKNSDLIVPEEIAGLRRAGRQAGEYTTRTFLDSRVKRAGLYHLVIPGTPDPENPGKGSIDNLFYETTLSDGTVVPPDNWAPKANKLAYANLLPVRTAEYARLISAGIVKAMTHLSTNEDENEAHDERKKIKVNKLLGKFTTQCGELPSDASDVRKLAYECLAGRGGSGKRPLIAELVLSKLDEHQLEKLGKSARALLVAGQPQDSDVAELARNHPDLYERGEDRNAAYLSLIEHYPPLDQTLVQIRDDLVRSAQAGGLHVLANEIKDIPFDSERSLP